MRAHCHGNPTFRGKHCPSLVAVKGVPAWVAVAAETTGEALVATYGIRGERELILDREIP